MPGLNEVVDIALITRKWPLIAVIILSAQDEAETVRAALARKAQCWFG